MPGELVQIVYTSTATVQVTEQMLRSIQRAALHHNPQKGITGLLLYGSGRFFHFFEGPAESTDELFARIRKDPRHKDIHLLFRRECGARSLEYWNMGVLNLEGENSDSRGCIQELDKYTNLMELTTTDEEADTVVQLITRVFQRYTHTLTKQAS